MGEDDRQFLDVASRSVSTLVELGLKTNDRVLDVGSGYGRLAYGLLDGFKFEGAYEGFDILPRHIEWCVENITDFDGRFKFRQLDIANARYNANGSIIANEARFPYADASFDFCVLLSVFTHMYSSSIRRYIRELRRVTRTGGLCLATFFLFSATRLADVVSENCDLPMIHRLSDVCRFHNPMDILHAISYDESFVIGMCEDAGFEVVKIRLGPWSQFKALSVSDRVDPLSYQDVLVLRAAPSPPNGH